MKRELPTDGRAITYQCEYRKCGKCVKCRIGNGHGPYWYAYWREGGKLKSCYVGRNLPHWAAGPRQEQARASIDRTSHDAHFTRIMRKAMDEIREQTMKG